MLGFSALSETPFAQATTSSEANAFISGAIGTFSQGSFTFVGVGRHQIPAAIATGAVSNLTTFSEGELSLSSVSGSISATAVGADAQATKSITGLSATSAVTTTTTDAKANQTPTPVVTTSAAGTFSFNAKANITLNAATAVANLIAADFEDEDGQALTTIGGVAATGAVSVNSDSALNGGIYSNNVVYLNTEFNRQRCVNIVPYTNYTVYIQKVSNY